MWALAIACGIVVGLAQWKLWQVLLTGRRARVFFATLKFVLWGAPTVALAACSIAAALAFVGGASVTLIAACIVHLKGRG